MVSPYLRPLVRARQAEINDVFNNAKDAYRRVRSFFYQNARYLHYRNVLGFGSSGVVTRWTETNQYGQYVRDFAVKAPVDENDPYFRQELNWMSEVFETAEHFVQLIYPSEYVIRDGLYNDYNTDNGSPALMILEYFERCELNELLVRVNETVTNNRSLPNHRKKLEFIPSRFLWRIFLCLARACIGMAYPPQWYNGRPEVYREVIRQNEEPQRIVHFDLHPLNVFIDTPFPTAHDAREHGLAPRFKLGDFGLMQEWDDGWQDEEKIAVADVGKPGYQAPEQRDRQRPLEDGAFGPHTNIWGAGLLMFNALTLYSTEDEDWAPRVCRITMPDGRPKDLNTWAPFLVGSDVYDDFKNYDVQLRTLIARCMADDRRDRPSLDELLRIIQDNIARGDAQAAEAEREFQVNRARDPQAQRPPVDVQKPPAVEDDELLRRFYREYIHEPPQREDPYKNLWD